MRDAILEHAGVDIDLHDEDGLRLSVKDLVLRLILYG